MEEAEGTGDDLLASLEDASKITGDGDADLVGYRGEEFGSHREDLTEGLGIFFGFG